MNESKRSCSTQKPRSKIPDATRRERAWARHEKRPRPEPKSRAIAQQVASSTRATARPDEAAHGSATAEVDQEAAHREEARVLAADCSAVNGAAVGRVSVAHAVVGEAGYAARRGEKGGVCDRGDFGLRRQRCPKGVVDAAGAREPWAAAVPRRGPQAPNVGEAVEEVVARKDQ